MLDYVIISQLSNALCFSGSLTLWKCVPFVELVLFCSVFVFYYALNSPRVPLQYRRPPSPLLAVNQNYSTLVLRFLCVYKAGIIKCTSVPFQKRIRHKLNLQQRNGGIFLSGVVWGVSGKGGSPETTPPLGMDQWSHIF